MDSTPAWIALFASGFAAALLVGRWLRGVGESPRVSPGPQTTPSTPPVLSARVIDHLAHRSWLAIVYLVATFFSSVGIVIAVVIAGTNWFHTHIQWRSQIEAELTGLHAGFTDSHFRQVLGQPLVLDESENHQFIERIFKGRGFWVQTISSTDGTVDLYDATVCDQSLRPTFDLVGVGPEMLNRSTFAHFTGRVQIDYDYQIGVASADPFMLEDEYQGGAADYVTYLWGVSSVCDPQAHWLLPLVRAYPSLENGLPSVVNHHDLVALRQHVVANTFGETAPFFYLSQLPPDLQVSVDWHKVLFTSPNSRTFRPHPHQPLVASPCNMGLQGRPQTVQRCGPS